MNYAATFGEMKRIYGICPCCGDPFRLSDASLFTRSAPPRTVFEKVDDAFERLNEQIDRFDGVEEEKREDARRLGQSAAKKRIRAIAPFFIDRKIDPGDVKVIFHPVDYIIFKGMEIGRCASVDLVDHPAQSRERETIQRSIDRAIRNGNLEWEVFRVDQNGHVSLDGAGPQ